MSWGFSESMELPLGVLDAINEATAPFRVRGVMERWAWLRNGCLQKSCIVCTKLKKTFATIIETVIGQPFLFLMSDIFDGKESKMSYIMQDFL